MPTFNPKSEEELNRSFNPLPEGEYDFSVTNAEETTSSKGRAMIKLRLKVFSGAVETSVFDYLVFTDKSQWKIYSFCKAVGLAEKFKAGEIEALDCQGRTGRVKLKIDKSDGYDDKNAVAHYVEVKGESSRPNQREDTSDVPF